MDNLATTPAASSIASILDTRPRVPTTVKSQIPRLSANVENPSLMASSPGILSTNGLRTPVFASEIIESVRDGSNPAFNPSTPTPPTRSKEKKRAISTPVPKRELDSLLDYNAKGIWEREDATVERGPLRSATKRVQESNVEVGSAQSRTDT